MCDGWGRYSSVKAGPKPSNGSKFVWRRGIQISIQDLFLLLLLLLLLLPYLSVLLEQNYQE